MPQKEFTKRLSEPRVDARSPIPLCCDFLAFQMPRRNMSHNVPDAMVADALSTLPAHGRIVLAAKAHQMHSDR